MNKELTQLVEDRQAIKFEISNLVVRLQATEYKIKEYLVLSEDLSLLKIDYAGLNRARRNNT